MLRLLTVLSVLTCFHANAQASRAEFQEAYKQSLVLTEEQKFLDAAKATYKALQIGEQLGVPAEEMANLEFNYGYLLVSAHRYDIACDVLNRAVKSFGKVHGKNDPKLMEPLQEYGHCLAQSDQSRSKSIGSYRRAEKIAKKTYGETSVEYAQVKFRMGQEMVMRLGDSKGRRHLKEALEIFEQSLGPDSNQALAAKFNLAKVALGTKKYGRAIEYLEEILASSPEGTQSKNRLVLAAHGFLVEAYEQNNQSEEATKHCLAIGKMIPEREAQDYIPLFKPRPIYPRSALTSMQEGDVIVEFSVDEFGFVQNPKVIDRTGSKVFDQPSLEVVKKFRYAPAFVDGKSVKTDGVRNRISYAIRR